MSLPGQNVMSCGTSFPHCSNSTVWIYNESGPPKPWSLKISWIQIWNWSVGSWCAQRFLVPTKYICLNDLQSKNKHLGLFVYPQKPLEESSKNRLIQSISLNVSERRRHAEGKGESKMVIWSEVRNETCHSKLKSCCLNYSGLLLKGQRVCGKRNGQRKKREAIYSGSKRDKEVGRYEKKE